MLFCLSAYWWVVVTMTTVGYGDMYPTTLLGCIVASCVMMLGLMITALPVAIIGRNYAILYSYNHERMKRRRVEKKDILVQMTIRKEEALDNFGIRAAMRHGPFPGVRRADREETASARF